MFDRVIGMVDPAEDADMLRASGRSLPPPCEALFPPREQRRYWNEVLTRELDRAGQRVASGPVTPDFDRDAFQGQLSEFDFNQPHPLGDVLAWSIAQLEHGVVHMTHPRYFGLFNPAPTFPAQCADRIAAAFNPQLATSTTSPAATEIEAHVVGSIARRLGLPPRTAGGHFTNGGSEANYTALICALTRSNPDFAGTGARAFSGPPVFYISNESHLAWLKIALQAGIGRDAARRVPTDGSGRMNTLALAEMVSLDKARGCVPVMIAATAGTTNAGMIDPLTPCAEIARECRLWYHVDAAWGGAAITSDRLRPLLAGIEHADSATIDAHKWFATTMGCGMFLIRDAAVLPAAFAVAASYMPSALAEFDPYVTSVQWSRRFVGLRLFLSLASAGWSGYAAHVERSIELIALLKDQLEAQRWRIVNDPALGVLCAEPPPGCAVVKTIVNRVLACGRAWVSAAMFEGRPVIRACVTHGETAVRDVERLAAELQAALDSGPVAAAPDPGIAGMPAQGLITAARAPTGSR
jgi:glutamate/tyrosine decarboxylase-like PLP-dependent enzyme